MKTLLLRAAMASSAAVLVAITASTSAFAAPRVLAAEHRGRLAEDAITWSSRYLVDCDGGGSVHFESTPPVDVPCARHIEISTTQTLARSARSHASLTPPLGPGDAVHLVELEGDGDARFEPSSSRIERHVGFFQATDVEDRARHEADAMLDRDPLGGGPSPIYVTSTHPVLTGAISTASERQRPAVIAIAIASIAVLLLLLAIYRWASREAAFEHAEQVLRDEFRDLESRGS